jgi:hypothetical protein
MKKLAYLASIMFCLSFVLQIAVSNYCLAKTLEVQSLYLQTKALESEVSLLNRKISSLSSIAYVEDKSRNLGFIKMSKEVKKITPPVLARAF